MFRYYIRNPRTSYATAVDVYGETTQGPAGEPVIVTSEYGAGDYEAAQHRLAALYPLSRVCGFCGGPKPCFRDD